MLKLIAGAGGRIAWAGRPFHTLVGGPEDEGWDAAIIVEYPSAEAVEAVMTSAAFADAVEAQGALFSEIRVHACAPLIDTLGPAPILP